MKQTYRVNKDHENRTSEKAEVSNFRRILPQVLACTVKNFLLLDLGLSAAFPTIVIPALTGLNNENNPNEILMLTSVQASWLGSVSYIFKLFGSILSGWITEPIGRKKALCIVNIPHVIAWIMLYCSTTLTEVFIGHSLLGLGAGLMEVPIITYVSEICEASIRGILTALSGIAATLGLFIVLLFGTLTEWRSAALYCLSVPVFTMIAVYFIPETPMWLLSKNRESDALKSLQWLRGWVSPNAVQKEFDEVKRYNEYSNACVLCEKAKLKCMHPPPTVKEKLKELLRKRTLKPFIILIIIKLVGHFGGMYQLLPYTVQILDSYGSPMSPNWAAVILGVTGIFATIACVVMVRLVGKRGIHLVTLSGTCLSNIALGIYGFYYLPIGCTSFSNGNAHRDTTENSSIFPLVMFIALRFCSTGIVLIPFMMLSELFPFKSRAVATGFTGAMGFVFQFASTKLFYNFESWLSLQGVMCLYGGICVIGLITSYYILPETEDRTLEDIEIHFSDNQRKFTDRNIQRISSDSHMSGVMIIECDKTNGTTVSNNANASDEPKQRNKFCYINKSVASDEGIQKGDDCK